jgi:hypothetical protein
MTLSTNDPPVGLTAGATNEFRRLDMGTVISRAARRTGVALAGAALIAVAMAPAVLNPAHAAASVTVSRIRGATSDNRDATQAAISQTEFTTAHSASNVIVTRGDIIPDGISASALAGQLHAPILLLGPPGSPIPPETSAEITRVLAPGGGIYVLGDLNSVDLTERTQLGTLLGGSGTLVNVDGTGTSGTRFISSADHATVAFTGPAGARPVHTFNAGNGALRTAFFANGFSLIDALCAGQLAFLGYPVFLVDNSKTTLDASVLSAMSSLGVEQGITLGDAKSLNSGLSTAIKNATAHPVTNESGPNRFATCATLATLGLSAPWSYAPATNVILTLGLPRVGDPNPPSSLVDSIGAGVLGGIERSPVILATQQFSNSTGLPPESVGFLTANATPIRTIQVPGSNASVPDSAATAAQNTVAVGSSPAVVSSIHATINSQTMTVTFSKPVWSASTCTTPGTGLCADFQVTAGGTTTPASSVAIAPSPTTANSTVTLGVQTAPSLVNLSVTITYTGTASFFVADQSGAAAASSGGSTMAGAPGSTAFTQIVASGNSVGAFWSAPVGLCATGMEALVDANTSISINGGAAIHPTAATSITNPPSPSGTIVAAIGSNSNGIGFTIGQTILAGQTVTLTFGAPVMTQICDSNEMPFTGTTQSTTA